MVEDWHGQAEPFKIHAEGLAVVIFVLAMAGVAVWAFW